MGAEGAVNILYKRELAECDDRELIKEKLLHEYKEKFANPYTAASRGFIDEIIMPSETRPKLIMALERTRTKVQKNPVKKHGNIPL